MFIKRFGSRFMAINYICLRYRFKKVQTYNDDNNDTHLVTFSKNETVTHHFVIKKIYEETAMLFDII